MKDIVLRASEIVLLIPAFGFLIPPVPSELGHTYNMFPGLAFAVVLFAMSQILAVYRDKRAWWLSILKIALFVVFGWIVFQRVTMGPMN